MRSRGKAPEPVVVDSTAWLLDSGFAEFLLLHTAEIRYMAMFGYTFLHGCKLFGTLPPNASTSYKFVSMIFQCTGGGILVPIFLNAIPVPLSNDAYPIAILLSFWLHNYVPILRDVVALSPIVKVVLIVLYESLRAAVVVKFTALAGTTIPPSDFGSVAVFGPIFCGTIAGCGGAFLPLNKGLDPIKDNGLAQPMLSAGMAATFYHIVTHCLPRWFPSLLLGVLRLDKKAHVLVAVFFVAYHWSTAFPTLKASPSKKTTTLGTTTTTGQESNSSAAMVTPSRPTTRGAGKRR